MDRHGPTTARLFGIAGMSCGACATGLERRMRALEGVEQASVHYLTASMLVRWDADVTGMAAIAERVRRSGYTLVAENRPEMIAARLERDLQLLARRLAIAAFFGMWSMAAAISLYVLPSSGIAVARWLAVVAGLLALPVVTYSGADIFAMAWKSLRLRDPGIDLLVSLGVLGSLLLSVWHLATGSVAVYFDTATMLITLLLVGRMVDLWIRRRAVAAIVAMETASPDLASRLRADGGIDVTPVTSVQIGDTIRVEAGATVSVDGVVVTGASTVNRAALTGESQPSAVGPGDRVEAGAINLTRRLHLCVDRGPGDRDLDRMGGRIALEIARRGQDVTRPDQWARRLSIAIPMLALLLGALTLLVGAGVEAAITRALTLLVGACPCALALAAPLAQVRASLAAASMGARVQNPAGLARLAGVTMAIFDKTGTLTSGNPGVVSVLPEPGWSETDMLALAAYAETGIDHPLARSIIQAHGSDMGDGGTRSDRSASGLAADGATITVTTAADETNVSGTRLQVLHDGRLAGYLVLDDPIAASAPSTIAALAALGIDCAIATGDNAGPAHRVAQAVGISLRQVHAACTPSAKADLVRAVGQPVLFVGDGINDGPALAAAACGLSVAGAHASASNTADIAVVDGSIQVIVPLVRLARRLARTIDQNIALATAYNLALVPLAAMGLMTPLTAALAMLVSSISVVLNTVRLGAGRAQG